MVRSAVPHLVRELKYQDAVDRRQGYRVKLKLISTAVSLAKHGKVSLLC